MRLPRRRWAPSRLRRKQWVRGPGYQKIEAKVTLDSPASEADIARLKDIVDSHCPVLDILRNPTPVDLSLRQATLSVAAE